MGDFSKFPLWIPIARGELGTKEIEGQQHNPRILEYHSATTPAGQTDEIPWCSAFVNWVMKKAGYSTTESPLARSWLKWGRRLRNPELGCVVILSRGREKWMGHVGFYMGPGKNDPSFIRVLGGNQGDQVSIEEFGRFRVLGYRMPK